MDPQQHGPIGQKEEAGVKQYWSWQSDSPAGLLGPWGQGVVGSRPSLLVEWVGIGKQSVRISAKQSRVQGRAAVPPGKCGAGQGNQAEGQL